MTHPLEESLYVRAKRILKLHITAVMGFFAALGFFIMCAGIISNITLVASLGSSLFSASTISAIFKVIGFDMYISGNLREAMDRQTSAVTGTIQSKLQEHENQIDTLVQGSIGQAFRNFGFVEALSENQCKLLFQKCLSVMRKGMPIPEIYDAFEDLSDELVGLAAEDRRYSVTLEHAKEHGPQILKETVTYSAKMVNQSSVDEVSLFPKDQIAEALVETPKGIDISKLQKPEDLARFVELHIDGQQVDPSKISTEYAWIDPNDKKKGSKFIAKYLQKVPRKPQNASSPTQVKISFTTIALLDETDYILRRFTSITLDAYLTVNHPEDLEIETTWFRPEKTRIHTTRNEPKLLEQNADGIFFPGMGFMLRTRKKKKDIKGKKGQPKNGATDKPVQ